MGREGGCQEVSAKWGALACKSNMDSGVGRLKRASWVYSPVPGERKSGIPALQLIPAPLSQTIRLHFLLRM